MSQKYTGGFITKSPVAPTTSAASGIWTLDQQQQAQKAGTWPSPPIFIEDIFSTYLVTGDGSAPAVNNGIDVSGKGGLVWIKKRSAAGSNDLFDTARGANLRLISNDTAAQDSKNLSFTSTGFSNYTFDSAVTYASWTFRKQPKFFDVVTYTGTGSVQNIAHSLGSAPGCIIVKDTTNVSNWQVYHRSLGATQYVVLNSTLAAATASNRWNDTAPTSSVFTIGDSSTVNTSSATYIAYLFAHDAGGFPVSGGGSTNGISCGSYTGNGSTTGPVITLGYEPQWLMIKNTANATTEWVILDNMRGIVTDGVDPRLFPNTSGAENTGDFQCKVNATGFQPESISAIVNQSGHTYIYIAIRRGPMKTPTVGTSVFSPTAVNNAQGTENTTGFPLDMQIANIRSGYASNGVVPSRLTGVSSNTTSSGSYLRTPSTNVEQTGSDITQYWGNTGFQTSSNWAGSGMVYWNFRRAPGFFDEVCYTGTGSATTFTHNLGVVPEMMIVKGRSSSSDWMVYTATDGPSYYYWLNDTSARRAGDATIWNSTSPTNSVFSVGTVPNVNGSGTTYVAYLFATCAGVSKVGSYTGNGTTQTINCGFTSGARFVIIKQTDAAGSWFTYDTARGMTVSTNPYLRINNTAAEIATLGSVTTVSTGFALDSNILPDINFNAGTYIFLAIA